jgi:acetyl-CoA carboxylase biotin carboxyl carrier protein
MPNFDVDGDLVRKLATLLEETGLTELEYSSGERRIRVVRGAALVPAVPPVRADTRPAESPTAEETDPGAVTAPMVGTIYLSPEPGKAPFVKPGDTVTEGQTLLLIEAMKTFNPVRAPRAGRIARILVADGSPVEYGEGLVILE